MSNRFTYVKYTQDQQNKQEMFKKLFEAVEQFGEHVLPEGRAKALFLTTLEESYMWTGKAIRDEQINICMTAQADHKPERG
jgi:hypothetical protein